MTFSVEPKEFPNANESLSSSHQPLVAPLSSKCFDAMRVSPEGRFEVTENIFICRRAEKFERTSPHEILTAFCEIFTKIFFFLQFAIFF